jgi:hypothetical protein
MRPFVGEAFADYIERVFREVQWGEFFLGEPTDFGGVAGGGEISRNPAAEKINQNVVILHALFRVAQDAVIDAQELAGFDGETGFFASFAEGGFTHQFADFENASGDGPFGPHRRVKTLYQYDARTFDDDGADADQREFGEFALHVREDSIAWFAL